MILVVMVLLGYFLTGPEHNTQPVGGTTQKTLTEANQNNFIHIFMFCNTNDVHPLWTSETPRPHSRNLQVLSAPPGGQFESSHHWSMIFLSGPVSTKLKKCPSSNLHFDLFIQTLTLNLMTSPEIKQSLLSSFRYTTPPLRIWVHLYFTPPRPMLPSQVSFDSQQPKVTLEVGA